MEKQTFSLARHHRKANCNYAGILSHQSGMIATNASKDVDREPSHTALESANESSHYGSQSGHCQKHRNRTTM